MTTAAAHVSPVIHPADDVIAVVDDARVDVTIGRLRAAGFTEADTHVFRMPDGIGVVARAWCRHSGVPATLAPRGGIREGPDQVAMTAMAIETSDRVQTAAVSPVADALARLLADTYTLHLKTHGYHWNVTGPHSGSLHLLFEEQYEELAEAADEIAERIRALGATAPGSHREMTRLTAIDDEEGVPDAKEMICRLIGAHETVIRTARAVMHAAEQADESASLDLATRRISVHETTLGMLRETEPGGDDDD
jgi:starvation-inducible DNA-binding protein